MEAFEDWLNGAEIHRRAARRPLVTLSYAQSLDGSLSARRGQPTQISGPESQRMTHQLRAMHQAILVGVGTVLSDDPRLTVRLVEGESPRPIVLDSRLRIPITAWILANHPKAAWIATTTGFDSARRSALEQAGGRVLVFPKDKSGRVDLAEFLECLAELGINSLLVEGGAQVISSFLSLRLADQVILTIAPVFLGGLNALEEGIFEHSGVINKENRPRLTETGYTMLGDDLIVWGKLS